MTIKTNFYTTLSKIQYLPKFSIVNELSKGYFYFGIYFLKKAYWFNVYINRQQRNKNNIFENIKYGDKFLTKDGRIALYTDKYCCGIGNDYCEYLYFQVGYFDYVTQEEIESKIE